MKKVIKYTGHLLSFIEAKRCWKKQIPGKSILFPIVWITRKCNLRCKMCDQWQTSSELSDKELTTKEWYTFADSAFRMNAATVIITGGEALLRPDMFDIIKYIRKYGISVHLCTNGTLINRETIKGLKYSGVDSISVSLDSCYANIHNQLRGIECFDIVVEGIRLMRKGLPKVKIGINTLMSRVNFRNIYKMISFAENLKVDQIKFAPIHINLKHKNNTQDGFKEIIFKEEDLPELRVEVDRVIKRLAKSKLVVNSRTFMEGIPNMYSNKYCRLSCYAGFISCSIDAFGNVSPCEDIDGNESIRDKPLEEIWKSRLFKELRDKTHNCISRCWDTTHTELNIRCLPKSLLKNLFQIFREINFYLN